MTDCKSIEYKIELKSLLNTHTLDQYSAAALTYNIHLYGPEFSKAAQFAVDQMEGGITPEVRKECRMISNLTSISAIDK